MRTGTAAAAVLVLALGGGAAMVQGAGIYNRVGAFEKGGPGVELRGGPSAGRTTPADQYTCPMHPEVTSSHPGKCPKCGMTLEKKAPEATPGQTHQHG